MTSYIYNGSVQKHRSLDGDHCYKSSSKAWQEASAPYRRQINLDDDSVTRIDNLVLVDMSGWTNKPSAADWTNYVRVYEHVDSTEVGTEINSQPIDSSWAGGNHDSVCFLCTGTDTKSTFTIYYGDTSLGAPSYTSDLTVTADSPAAGDYTIVQDSYYTAEIDYSSGGSIDNLWTRVSGGDTQIGLANDAKIGKVWIRDNADVSYSSLNEATPTITEVEGSTGANAGAVLVAFKVTGDIETGAHVSLTNASYELIYIFMDNSLFQVVHKCIFTGAQSLKYLLTPYDPSFVDGYFSHQGYKYSSTHAVETIQDRDISGNYSTKKYLCLFDTTSDDGIAAHFITEDFERTEDELYKIDEGAATDAFYVGSDASNDADSYSTYTNSITITFQIDDFTEADGNNDTDGDQPAHRKNDELLTTLTQTDVGEIVY